MSISRKLACGVLAAGAPLAAAGGLALASSSAAATHRSGSPLPTLTLHMNGKSIKVTGSKVSGAVDVRSMVTGEKRGTAILVRLNQGVTMAQFQKALSQNDPNAVQLVGAIVFNTTTFKGQTTNVDTVLQPARYVALDVSGKQPIMQPFTVTKSSSPAKLPTAAATTKAIEFAFRGATTLKDNTMVRAINKGWLVHMDDFVGVKSAKAGKKLIKLFKSGSASRKAVKPYLSGSFFELFGPVSHGAVQQQILNAKPGYYVEACFMDTQDGREHVALGMERLVHVVK